MVINIKIITVGQGCPSCKVDNEKIKHVSGGDTTLIRADYTNGHNNMPVNSPSPVSVHWSDDK